MTTKIAGKLLGFGTEMGFSGISNSLVRGWYSKYISADSELDFTTNLFLLNPLNMYYVQIPISKVK